MRKTKVTVAGIVFITFIIALFFQPWNNDSELVKISFTDTLSPAEPDLAFGIPSDSFEIHKGTIAPNQFLADILLQYHVSYPEIEKIVEAADTVFSVLKLRAGKQYAVFCNKDSIGKARYFVYQPNIAKYILFDLSDTPLVSIVKKEVVFKEETASGKINSSLYKTLQQQHITSLLALEMADIYAWTIDFYRLMKGDRFNVVYMQGYIDGKPAGSPHVVAAMFHHRSDDIYAFYFRQDSLPDGNDGDYFDEKGQSLRKAFLKSPLKFSRISSGFTYKRFHPVQKRWKAHLGTDYAAPKGTPIMSVGDGVVIESAYKHFNGNYVKIRHNSTYTTQYLHMSKRAIKVGQHVGQGDIIGYVGSTGLATGPHVCFRFWKNGQQVDHRKEKFPPSKPVRKENLTKFKQVMEDGMKKLNSI